MPSITTTRTTITTNNAFFSTSTMTIILLLTVLLNSLAARASPTMVFGQRVSEGHSLGLRKRESVCPSGFGSCRQNGLTDFCCPFNNFCTGLGNNTQVSCCPEGSDCRIVQAVDCGTSGVINGTHCTTGAAAGKCCPQDYLCSPIGCQMDAQFWPSNFEGSLKPPTNGSLVIAPAGSNSSKSNAFPGRAVAVGIIPGIIIGALLMYLFKCLWGRRKQSRVKSFKRMPETSLMSGTQNVHPSHMRMASSISNQKQSMSTDLVIGFNPNEQVINGSSATGGAVMHGALPASSSSNQNCPVHHELLDSHSRKSSRSNNEAPNQAQGPMGYQSNAPSIRPGTQRTRDEEEATRRGRLHVHGETPQLPSLHIGASMLSPTFPNQQQPVNGFGLTPMVTSSESYVPGTTTAPPRTASSAASVSTRPKGHKRTNSNPSYNDVSQTRLPYQGELERVRSFGSDTSVSSSIHSSIASERSVRTMATGKRYPIKVTNIVGASQRNATQSSVALPMTAQSTPQVPAVPHLGIKIGVPKANNNNNAGSNQHLQVHTSLSGLTPPSTRDYRNTTFELEDDMTPITPMSPLDANKPVPPPAPEPPTPGGNDFYMHPGNSTWSFDVDAEKRMSTISHATTVGDPALMYKSFVHDTDAESVCTRNDSMYPQSFYDVHFEASPVSAGGPNGNSTPTLPPNKTRQMTMKLDNVPAVPVIPALFAGNNRPRKSILTHVVSADSLNSNISNASSIPDLPPMEEKQSCSSLNNSGSSKRKSGFDSMVSRNKSLRRDSEHSDRSAEVPFAIDNGPPRIMMSPGMPPKSPGAWSFMSGTTNITVPTVYTTAAPNMVVVPAPPPVAKKFVPPAGGLGSVTMNGGRYTMQTQEMMKAS